MQLPLKVYRHIQGIIGLNSDDVVLASFPKSGNTWIRFLFAHLILQEQHNACSDQPVLGFTQLDTMMPEFGISNLLKNSYVSQVPRIVKTHKPNNFLFRDKPVILLVRDPKDVMASYFFYETGKLQPRFSGSFHEFIRHPRFGLRAWFQHYQSWQSCPKKIVIRFESLKQNTEQVLTSLLDFLELQIPPEQIRAAVERSSFANLKAVEANAGLSKQNFFKKDFAFIRSGKTGSWQDLFDAEDLALYQELQKQFQVDEYAR